jgi:hypothetical protein
MNQNISFLLLFFIITIIIIVIRQYWGFSSGPQVF